jgi:hypothetical protein
MLAKCANPAIDAVADGAIGGVHLWARNGRSRLDRNMPDFRLWGRTEDCQTDRESNDGKDAANEHNILLPPAQDITG